MKFDEIIQEIGEFGLYQKRLYFLVCLPAITVAIHGLSPVFIFDIPSYRCEIPGLTNDSYSNPNQGLVNRTIPYIDGTLSQCKIFTNETFPEDNKTETCDKWVYDRSVYIETAVTEFNLVCGKELYRTHINMITYAGNVFGCLVYGMISDIIGRKKTLIFTFALHIGAGIGTAFITDFTGLAILRFLDGSTNSGIFLLVIGIGMELVGPSKRTFAGIFIEFFWSLGLLSLVALAYIFRDWRHLVLAGGIPPVVFLSYAWLMPESPRWLLAKGRNQEAEDILKRVAMVNKRELPKNMFDENTINDGPESSILLLFKSPRLVVNCFILYYNWFVVNLVYYGITLNVSNLSGNIFLNFTVSTLAEMIGYACCLLFLDRLGRKVYLCTCMIVGGLACLSTMFTAMYGNESHDWINIVLSNIGKLGVSGAFALMFVYTAELYPTIVRNSGLGTSTFVGQIGAIVSPYIADLSNLVGGKFSTALPLIVFGGLSLLAGLLTLFLPETLHRPLPETVEDARLIARGIFGNRRGYENKAYQQYKHPTQMEARDKEDT